MLYTEVHGRSIDQSIYANEMSFESTSGKVVKWWCFIGGAAWEA